jgi:hypothetical protein
MSGVYDHKTGKFVMRHSTDEYPTPPGSVARYGGHSDVRGELGTAVGEDLGRAEPGRVSGFSMSRQADGTPSFGWNSGQVNPGSHGTRSVPEEKRPEIENAVLTSMGR